MHATTAKSPEYTRGYIDNWCGVPAKSLMPDYQRGWFAGMEAKRILDELDFSTDNSKHPELRFVA